MCVEEKSDSTSSKSTFSLRVNQAQRVQKSETLRLHKQHGQERSFLMLQHAAMFRHHCDFKI